ncbi:MAG: hypothetical protein PUI52_07590 [Bacteroidales bacterium]|nr:hypothetical protein [Bacteroidales bacterium]MDY6170074.1 hypothetical protein [Candidatus Cryptobacteroides sp.]
MKTNFLKVVMALLGVGCILATSCLKNQETLKPVFPENKVVKTLSAGESTDIEFEANQDWTLKVQGDGAGNYFGIIDEGIMETSVSGKAGHQTVTVGFSADEDFDEDRVCAVVLEMGGESMEIAQLTKMRGNRVLNVYAAVVDEFDFKKNGDSYEYPEETASSLTLVTFAGKTTYSLPIKVVSNFKWLLNTDSQYVNASVTEANADGEETEVLLSLKTDESLAAGATIDIKFLTSDEEGAPAYTYQLTIPAFGQRMEIDNQSTLHFNKEGQLLMPTGSFADQPGICYVLGPKGSKIKALEWNAEKGWYETSFASWVHADLPFDDEKGYLQNAIGQITVDANDGAERYADLIVLPASLTSLTVDDLLNTEGDAIKDEYKKYVITTQLIQEGTKKDFVSFDESIAETYKAKLEKNATADVWMKSYFETVNDVFTLTYSDKSSDCALAFESAVSRFEVYDYAPELVSQSALENFWLEFIPIRQGMAGRVNMYPQAYVPIESETPESFIVLYDSEDNALTAIRCVYDTAGTEEETNNLEVASGNATIEKLTSGDVYNFLSSELSVTDIYDVTLTGNASVILNSLVEFEDYAILTVSFPMKDCTDGSLTFAQYGATQFSLTVGENVTEFTSWVVVLKGEYNLNKMAIYFSYDPGM